MVKKDGPVLTSKSTYSGKKKFKNNDPVKKKTGLVPKRTVWFKKKMARFLKAKTPIMKQKHLFWGKKSFKKNDPVKKKWSGSKENSPVQKNVL